MSTDVMRRVSLKAVTIVATIAIVGAIGFLVVTKAPEIRKQFAAFFGDGKGAEGDAPPDHAAHEDEDGDILVLSSEARATLNPTIKKLRREPFVRPLQVQGIVVPIAGVTQQDITTASTARVTRIYVREGQTVAPGDPLFDLSIVAPEAINTQLEMIDALANLEGVAAEIHRLSELPFGSIAGKEILQQRYLREQLLHTVTSRRDTLLLIGFDKGEVDTIIQSHRERHIGENDPSHEEYGSLLLSHISIVAPLAADQSVEQGYVVEHIAARLGEQVEGGRRLCQLGDYSQLHIKGEAFERSFDVIRRAAANDWKVTATWEESTSSSQSIQEMSILFIAPEIDPETRTTHFHIAVENEAIRLHEVDGRRYVDWRFRPGLRMDLQVPIEQYEETFVVPIEAVAHDGIDNYIFQVIRDGTEFRRIAVTVLYRGPKNIVLADEGLISGINIATSGAYQLQMALQAQEQGSAGVDPHAGHSHD